MEETINNDSDIILNIINLLDEFIGHQDEKVRSLYAAVYYLIKIEIRKFPKNIIIVFIFASYDIALKVANFEICPNMNELVLTIYNKIQKKIQ